MDTRIITLKDITPAFGMADYVAFTLKEGYDNRHNIPNYDPIVMYLKCQGDGPDYWFDRAHVAETLSPMSLWEIKDEERAELLKWLEEEHSPRQLDILLSNYVEALDWAEDHPGESLPDALTTRHHLTSSDIDLCS